MLKIAVILSLAMACLAQEPPRPNIAETFVSYLQGNYEYHDSRGVFFGTFVNDRDQTAQEAVENSTAKAGNITEHYEKLERYDMGTIYTLRDEGKGEPHCQQEKSRGNLSEFWGWIRDAKYAGEKVIHEITYDEWTFSFGGVELNVDILREKPDIPSYYERVTGGNILRFQFIGFMPTTPPTNAFDIPPECKM